MSGRHEREERSVEEEPKQATTPLHAAPSSKVSAFWTGIVQRKKMLLFAGVGVAFVALMVLYGALISPSLEKEESNISSFEESDRSFDGVQQSTLPDTAGDTTPSLVRYTKLVEETLQYPELPAGCESVSLASVLRAMGYEVSPTEIVDDYLPYDELMYDFVTAYAGSPYLEEGGGAFPPAMVTAANAYLNEHGASERAQDLTGSSFEELTTWVKSGRPVLVWTTMYMDDPVFSYELEGNVWYINEHCVVLCGVDGEYAQVMDPLEGMVAREVSEFARIYEACGSHALVIS